MLPPQSGDAHLTNVVPSNSADGAASNGGALVPIGPVYPMPANFAWPGAAPARPTFLTSGPDPVTLLHALRRKWLPAFGFGTLAAIVVAAIAWFLIPADYEVQALFEVRQLNESKVLDDSIVRVTREEHENFKKTQTTLVKSPLVLNSALRREEIAQLPSLKAHRNDMLTFLTDEILVDYPGGSDILRIRMRGEDADELVKIVDAVKDAYSKEVLGKEKQEKLKKRDTVEQEFRRIASSLSQKQKDEINLSRDMKAGGTEAVQYQMSLLMTQLQNLQLEERNLSREVILANQKIEEIKALKEKSESAEPTEWAIMQVLRGDPRFQSLQMEMQTVDQAISQTTSVIADPNSPRLQSLSKQKADVEARMDELRLEAVGPAKELMMGQSMGALAIDERNAQASLESLEAQVKSVKEEKDAVAARLNDLGGNSADLMGLRQEVETLSAQWQRLQDQLRMMDLELSGDNSRVQLVMSAQKPEGNEWIFKYFLTGLCTVGAFGLTMFAITYGEFQARRISTATQVSDGLGMKVVGSLPCLAGNNDAMLPTILNESIDRVRTLLLHATGIDGTKIVMVTSAVDLEGKTTVASQLAASLARCGRRTLLLDADIRSPSLHELFDMPAEPGLCEVLRGELELDDAIRPTRLPSLWLLPGGRCDGEAVQALAKDAIAGVLSGLRPEFDFIILDSAPVLTVADSLSVGQHVDATIVSVLKDVSQGAKVFDAVERLRGVGINVMGAVVNGETQRVHRRLIDLQPAAA